MRASVKLVRPEAAESPFEIENNAHPPSRGNPSRLRQQIEQVMKKLQAGQAVFVHFAEKSSSEIQSLAARVKRKHKGRAEFTTRKWKQDGKSGCKIWRLS